MDRRQPQHYMWCADNMQALTGIRQRRADDSPTALMSNPKGLSERRGSHCLFIKLTFLIGWVPLHPGAQERVRRFNTRKAEYWTI